MVLTGIEFVAAGSTHLIVVALTVGDNRMAAATAD